MHAFTQAYPLISQAWEHDNNIVVLEHEDLTATADMLDAFGLAMVRFHEPDLDGALTAICVEPAAKPHVREIRLAG